LSCWLLFGVVSAATAVSGSFCSSLIVLFVVPLLFY
jgi:hypothetical protein